MILRLEIKDVMVTDLVTVALDVGVQVATRIMNDFEIGCLLVVSGRRLVGIVTERDILRRVVVKRRDPAKTKISEVMSQKLITVTPETPLEKAIQVMFKHKIKKLPVVEKGKLVGLVTFTDLVRIEPVITKYIQKLASKYSLPPKMKKHLPYIA